MYEKDGKFYADWRDKRGARKRKSFRTERAALIFEREQKEIAHPKRKAKGQQSPNSFTLSSLGKLHRQEKLGQQEPSSPKPGRSRLIVLAPPMSRKSTRRSTKAVTSKARKSTARTR